MDNIQRLEQLNEEGKVTWGAVFPGKDALEVAVMLVCLQQSLIDKDKEIAMLRASRAAMEEHDRLLVAGSQQLRGLCADLRRVLQAVEHGPERAWHQWLFERDEVLAQAKRILG